MPIPHRILVVEEETLLALDIEFVLANRFAIEMTHFRSAAEVSADPARFAGLGLAILEARLGAEDVVQLAASLAAAGVPVIVMSADHASAAAFPGATWLAKPFDDAGLLSACVAANARLS